MELLNHPHSNPPPLGDLSHLADAFLDELHAVLLQVADLFLVHGLLLPQLLIAGLATRHEHW